jgi:hypothetical protein
MQYNSVSSQSVTNISILGTDSIGQVTSIQTGDRIVIINPNLWNGTNWDKVGFYLADIMNIYDKIDSLTRKSPIAIENTKVRAPNLINPRFVEREGISLILLSSSENYWSKFVYQYGHEYMHYMINRPFKPNGDRFAWFEETLCEMSSLFVLKELQNMNSNEKIVDEYRRHFDSYYNLTTSNDNLVDVNSDIGDFINLNHSYLVNERYDRKINRTVAINLLKLFISESSLWIYVKYLNKIDDDSCKSFSEYLDAWREQIPKSEADDFYLIESILK